jgi:hypothetical protein
MVYRTGNVVKNGSTTSGKSFSEIPVICDAADEGTIAICVEDPHERSLAYNSAGHLIARGHKKRLIWDALHDLRAPKYVSLEGSRASDPLMRAMENYRKAEQFAEVLCRRREQSSLGTAPLTEEWTMKAIQLFLNQPHPSLASDLRYCLQPRHPKFQQFYREVTDDDVKFQFEDVASGKIKPGQYAAARRLIEAVTGHPAFVARCGRSLDLADFYDRCGILLVQGGPVSQVVVETILGSICLQTIQYVRTRSRAVPRVLLVLDEATNCNLIGAAGHEVRALAECQKMGLDMHILVQAPNFPNPNEVFTNCTRHEWFYAASAAIERKGMEDLGMTELDPPLSKLSVGERWVKDGTRVFHDFATRIESPWVFPELTDRKIRRAIADIQQRKEYGELPCSTGSAAAATLQTTRENTSAPRGTSSDISPAKRLRTARSKSCTTTECCDASAK